MNPPLEPVPFRVLFSFFVLVIYYIKTSLACFKRQKSFNKDRYFGGYSKVF